jgi:hypothetical protein
MMTKEAKWTETVIDGARVWRYCDDGGGLCPTIVHNVSTNRYAAYIVSEDGDDWCEGEYLTLDAAKKRLELLVQERRSQSPES